MAKGYTKSTGVGEFARKEREAKEATAHPEYGSDEDGAALTEDDWLSKSKREFRASKESEQEDRNEAAEDDKFKLGGKHQWPEYAQRSRIGNGNGQERPMFTLNEVAKFANHIGNEAKQNRPQIKLVPGNEEGAKETAEVMTDLIRHIMSRGQGDYPQESAVQQAIDGGWGYMMVTANYIDDLSNVQELEVQAISNRFTVYPDPMAQTPWLEDMDYCFMSWEVHRDELPAKARGEWESSQTDKELWVSERGSEYRRIAVKWWRGAPEKIRVASADGEEERVVTEERRVSNNAVEDAQEKRKGSRRREKAGNGFITRDSVDRPVYYQRMTGNMVLEEPQKWPGKWIPIVRIVGEITTVNGVMRKKGIIRDAKDAQRIVNYEYTSAVEDIALGIKAGVIAAEGQLEHSKEAWIRSMYEPVAILEYTPVPIQDADQLVLAPPPVLNPRSTVPDGNLTMLQTAHQMLRETTGVFESQLGQQANEQSGRAINARRSQGGLTNHHFMDNMLFSLRHMGKILVDVIPKYYDTPRLQRILAEDGEQSMVEIDPSLQDPMKKDVSYQEIADVDVTTGKKKISKKYRLDIGKYDVRVTTGKSYANRQQEMVESLGSSLGILGEQALLVLPEWYKAMDWPGAEQISELLAQHRDELYPHLRKLNPGEEGGDPKQEAQQLRSVLQQLMPQMQEMAAEMEQMSLELESKKMEVAAKIFIAKLKYMSEVAESDGQIETEKIRGTFKMLEKQAEMFGSMSSRPTPKQ